MAVTIKKGSALDNLSLTPLIDIVFLLLIFFLVATRFAEEDREMDVPLPSASEAMPLIVQPQEIFVNIDKDGGYFVSRKKMNLAQIEAHLKEASVNNPGRSVIVRADKRCPLDYVVQVMNICNRSRIEFSLTTSGEGG